MNEGKLGRQRLAAAIEHTFLKAYGPPGELERLCREAREHGFVSVVVNPVGIERCRALLDGTTVRIGTVIGFPLGQSTSVVKAFEVQDALARGADDVDFVINVRALQAGNTNVLRRELASLAEACRQAGAVSKAILETCYLDEGQKRVCCKLALENGIDFVKTSTGFGSGGATVADVRLMRAAVSDKMGVKASAGIRELRQAVDLLDAGANRLGTSSGVALMAALADSAEADG